MEQFANLATTTLNGSILPGDLTLVVSDASAFPTLGNFRLLIENEILLVTGVAGTTFTVTRGIEGTTPVGHGSGTGVEHILTAGALEQYRTDLVVSLGKSIFDLQKGIASDDTGVPTTIGATYVDASLWPVSRTVKFRCILESSNAIAAAAATADLFDTEASLAGSPAPVAGSQVDNTGAPSPLIAAMVESDVTAAFAGFAGTGVFEARLWINTAGGGNIVTCKSAQLIVE